MERLRKKPSKLLLVSSSGGHLKHLTATFDAWQNYERVWVSFKQPDVESALAEEKVYWAYYPTTPGEARCGGLCRGGGGGSVLCGG